MLAIYQLVYKSRSVPLLSDSYSVWLQQPSLKQPVFFLLACTFVLTGAQLLNDGHLPPILDVTQGDPPPQPLGCYASTY